MFYKLIEERGRNWLERELIKFFTVQNKRAENKEISPETIKNYLKPVKLFCEMNGVIVNWKIISKGIKRGDRCSNDRPPSKEEIQKLLEYPDRRIKLIVLIMVSSGIRVGSWGYLKWGDITPIIKSDSIVAAKSKYSIQRQTNIIFPLLLMKHMRLSKNGWSFANRLEKNLILIHG